MIDKKGIYDLLDSKGIEYENYDHIPVYTVAEAETLDIPHKEKGLKNLFLKDKKHNYYLVSLNGGKSIDLKKLRAFLGCTPLHFANAQELLEITGLEPGHVTPFGILNSKGYPVKSVFDVKLAGDIIGIHPMSNDATIIVSFDDIRDLIEESGFEVLMYEV